MLNVVFSDSALGSLKVAPPPLRSDGAEYRWSPSLGRSVPPSPPRRWGRWKTAATSVILLREDGSPGTPEELERAVREYEERERRAWEKAVPMDGSPGDSYGFSLCLSQGAIPQGADIWEDRNTTFNITIPPVLPPLQRRLVQLPLFVPRIRRHAFGGVGEGDPAGAGLHHQRHPRTLIFYEAPHKLRATLADMAAAFGGERRVTLCREITKIYEE